ncbi:MAG: winged helix-turn-helix transcriptional regulator [Paludibacteraceae bacterium]
MPLRTEYRLTSLAESTLPIIQAMDKWGLEHSRLFDELGQLKQSI